MKIPAEFDSIRPFEPEELPRAVESLLADPQFLAVAKQVYPGYGANELRQVFQTCPDNLSVQKTLFRPLLEQLEQKCCTELTADFSALPEKRGGYAFVSNHRDIVMDSAFLALLLLRDGFPTTMEIAIGDNLLIYPWIRTLVRINKSFVVQRSVTLRQRLESSRLMSRYMHYVITCKQDNLWIAQREGRSKDNTDRTQDAVLKMMAMGGEGLTPHESLRALHLVPLCISYEYDPCDALKAAELQQRRDNPRFSKQPADDLRSMQTGIFGYKGRVSYIAAPPADTWLDEYAGLGKAAFFEAVARRIDREIHLRYRLYPGNYAAADMLEGGSRFAERYTASERCDFERYVADRISAVSLPGKDEAFLRHILLTMYANPLYNHLRAAADAAGA